MSFGDDRLFGLASRSRLLAVSTLERLAPVQWATASPCEGWTVHEVAAHLVAAADVGLAHLAAKVVRHRSTSTGCPTIGP